MGVSISEWREWIKSDLGGETQTALRRGVVAVAKPDPRLGQAGQSEDRNPEVPKDIA